MIDKQSASTISIQVGEAPAQDGTTEASTALYAPEHEFNETGACETRSLYLNTIVLSRANAYSGDESLPFRCVQWRQERGLLSILTDRRIPAATFIAFDILFRNPDTTQAAQRVTVRVGDGKEEPIGTQGARFHLRVAIYIFLRMNALPVGSRLICHTLVPAISAALLCTNAGAIQPTPAGCRS